MDKEIPRPSLPIRKFSQHHIVTHALQLYQDGGLWSTPMTHIGLATKWYVCIFRNRVSDHPNDWLVVTTQYKECEKKFVTHHERLEDYLGYEIDLDRFKDPPPLNVDDSRLEPMLNPVQIDKLYVYKSKVSEATPQFDPQVMWHA